MISTEKGLFQLVEGGAVEGKVFRTLADAGDAALVAGHVFGCELGESVLLAGIFDHVVLAYGQLCSGGGVDDFIADFYAVLQQIEISEFRINEFRPRRIGCWAPLV